jgi:hypothetical protein
MNLAVDDPEPVHPVYNLNPKQVEYSEPDHRGSSGSLAVGGLPDIHIAGKRRCSLYVVELQQ